MTKILLFSLVFYSLFFQSQKLNDKLQFRKNEKFNQKISSEERNRIIFNIFPIEEYDDLVNIRILFPRQIIELSKNRKNEYVGLVINKTTQYNYSKRDNSQLINTVEFFNRTSINSDKTKEIIDKLILSNQVNFPTDSLIQNWNRNYLHCNDVDFQFKTLNHIKKQKYSCPLYQNEEEQTIKIVADNIKFIQSQLKLDSIYKSFENSLPLGKNYSYDGYRMMYKFTKKQNETWEKYKPYREFLKLKKDTIDTYLKGFIQNNNLKSQKINCFEKYNLEFSKKGNLKKIFVSKFDKPKWKDALSLKDFLKDKREIKKCEKIIEEIFLNTDLSWLNLKFNLNRTISFDLNGNPQLSDDTIY